MSGLFFIINHFTVRMNKNILWINLFGDVRPQFVLSHQDGVLVGHDGVLGPVYMQVGDPR